MSGDAESRMEPLEVVHRLSCAIAKAADLQQVYQILLDEVVEILGVERASIMVYDKARGGLVVAAARGMDRDAMQSAFVRIGEGISGQVFESDEPMLVQDIRSRGEQRRGDRGYKTQSLMSAPVTCFPMKVGDMPLGVINVTDKKDGSSFTETDLKLLTTASNQVAAYAHICDLADEVKEAERVWGELEVARSIQQRLLPAKPLDLDSLDVVGKVVAARRVGGDYYDYFLTLTRKPTFVIADVSGHNIPAALIMAALRSVIRSQRDADFAPAALIHRVNTMLFDDLSSTEQFVSMVYMQYLHNSRTIRYTTAGHPAPLVWRKGVGDFEELTTDDPLIGIDPLDEFHEKALAVSSGDLIILYTDGVLETPNLGGDRFGTENLKAVIRGVADRKASEIVDAVVDGVMEFARPREIRDDLTVLVCKVL